MLNTFSLDYSASQNFHFSFLNTSNDTLMHLVHWQYWFWFWFSFLLALYYVFFIRFFFFRTLKFNPKIATSFRSHGKWGDLIICLLPVSWCLNILSNSTTLLKLVEWQQESNFFTLRVRGKQWYWVYKLDIKSIMDISNQHKLVINVGNNSVVQPPVDFLTSLKFRNTVENFFKFKSQNAQKTKLSDLNLRSQQLVTASFLNTEVFNSWIATNVTSSFFGSVNGDKSLSSVNFNTSNETPSIVPNNFSIFDMCTSHNKCFNTFLNLSNESHLLHTEFKTVLGVLHYYGCCFDVFCSKKLIWIIVDSYFNIFQTSSKDKSIVDAPSTNNLLNNEIIEIIDNNIDQSDILANESYEHIPTDLNNSNYVANVNDNGAGYEFEDWYLDLVKSAVLKDGIWYGIDGQVTYPTVLGLDDNDLAHFTPNEDLNDLENQKNLKKQSRSDINESNTETDAENNNSQILNESQTSESVSDADANLIQNNIEDVNFTELLNTDDQNNSETSSFNNNESGEITSEKLENSTIIVDSQTDSEPLNNNEDVNLIKTPVSIDSENLDERNIGDLIDTAVVNVTQEEQENDTNLIQQTVNSDEVLLNNTNSTLTSDSTQIDNQNLEDLTSDSTQIDNQNLEDLKNNEDIELHQTHTINDVLDQKNIETLTTETVDSTGEFGQNLHEVLNNDNVVDFDSNGEVVEKIDSVNIGLDESENQIYDETTNTENSTQSLEVESDDVIIDQEKHTIDLDNSKSDLSNIETTVMPSADLTVFLKFYLTKIFQNINLALNGNLSYWSYDQTYGAFEKTDFKYYNNIISNITSNNVHDIVVNSIFFLMHLKHITFPSKSALSDPTHSVWLLFLYVKYILLPDLMSSDNSSGTFVDTFPYTNGAKTVVKKKSLLESFFSWLFPEAKTETVETHFNNKAEVNNFYAVQSVSEWKKQYVSEITFYKFNKINLFLNNIYNAQLSDFYISRAYRESIFQHHHITLVKANKMDYFLSNKSNVKQIIKFQFNFIPVKDASTNLHLVFKQKPISDWSKFDTSVFFKNSNFKTDNNSNDPELISMLPDSTVFNDSTQINYYNNSRLLRVNKVMFLPTMLHIAVVTNSFDVIHSWFIPGLGLKMDCVPGRSTHHTLFIDIPGMYYGQCAEICGRFHHHMPIRICALPFEHFILWFHHFVLPSLSTLDLDTAYTKFKKSINSFF